MNPDSPETGAVRATHDLHARLSRVPREVGVLLVTIGVLGLVLPGLMGTPALLAGGLLLWPKGFRSANNWLGRRCPKLHGQGLSQLVRYLDDMERRYPSIPTESPSPSGGSP